MKQPSLPPVAARPPVDNLPAHSARLWTARRWRVRRYAHRLPCWGYSHLKNAGWAADASLRSLSASRQARKAAHSRVADQLHWETAVNGLQQTILRRQWGEMAFARKTPYRAFPGFSEVFQRRSRVKGLVRPAARRARTRPLDAEPQRTACASGDRDEGRSPPTLLPEPHGGEWPPAGPPEAY